MNSRLDINAPPPRPRIADASPGTILWAIAGGLIGGPIGAFVGGAAGYALANQPQPLEMAIREFLSKKNFEVVFFYPAPRGAKVTFRDNNSSNYWTVESRLPDNINLTPDQVSDWLYFDLTNDKLTPLMCRIRNC